MRWHMRKFTVVIFSIAAEELIGVSLCKVTVRVYEFTKVVFGV